MLQYNWHGPVNYSYCDYPLSLANRGLRNDLQGEGQPSRNGSHRIKLSRKYLCGKKIVFSLDFFLLKWLSLEISKMTRRFTKYNLT